MSEKSAPSIGVVGRVAYDAKNDRCKGLLTEVAQSEVHLRRILIEVIASCQHGSRLVVRMPVARGVRPAVRGLDWHGFEMNLEAFVPIKGHPTIDGLAYYGATDVKRAPSQATRAAERALFMRVLEMPYTPLPNTRVNVLGANAKAEDVRDIVSIYQASYATYLMEFNERSVQSMIADNTVLVVRDSNGRVASVCVAESVVLRPHGIPPIRLVEISDAATRPDARGNGYYSAAKHRMVEMLRANADGIPTAITTEARANAISVLRSNVRLGVDFVYAGYEPAHVIISSSDLAVAQEGKYGNLVIFCAP